ncbi:MAG TPA: hypothetical protein VFZ97_06745 [Acidimicrobiales bacterium]
MSVTVSDDDWNAIYAYFHASFTAADNSGIHHVMDLQEEAWRRVQRIAADNGQSVPDPTRTAGLVSPPSDRQSGPLMGEQNLREEGFRGFLPFSALASSGIPDEPGVYVVLRRTGNEPAFRQSNPGGRFKGQDPTVTADLLQKRWVANAPVVYIGKATRLLRRLRDFRDFGAGKPVGHWGGRLIWQLADADELVVAWKVTPSEEPREAERSLLDRFRSRYGSLPFANLQT